MTDKKYWSFKSNYNRPLFLMKELVKITLNCQFKIII